MEAISELRDKILFIYGRFELYILPVVRFIVSLVTLIIINSKLGYMSRLSSPLIVIAVSLISAFLPMNFTIIIAALFILLHTYSLSLEAALIVGLIFILMVVLYFRFSPKEAAAVILTPIFFVIKIPYVVPLTLGFVGGPLSFISTCCGVVVYYIMGSIGDMGSGSGGIEGFKGMIDIVIGNDTMILMIIVFAILAILANVIKRFPFDYSWQVALVISAVAGLITVIIGASALDADLSIGGAVISILISMLLVFVLQLFIHNIDYSRAEKVEFEDEEYFYYVKAIPRFLTETRPNTRPVDSGRDYPDERPIRRAPRPRPMQDDDSVIRRV